MADDDQYNDQYQGGDSSSAKVCKVYDKEDFFTVFVQLSLALFALLSLWFKRQNEVPKRKFRTWFLDISKQGLGACYAHVCNMVRFNEGTNFGDVLTHSSLDKLTDIHLDVLQQYR